MKEKKQFSPNDVVNSKQTEMFMCYFLKQRLVIFIALLCLFLNASCRSSIKTPVTETVLNQYDQIDTVDRRDPDSRGIITYDTYQVLIANGDETIGEIAQRLGIGADKLALYNGLIVNYRPRQKEMIALPDDQFLGQRGWSKEITTEKIDQSDGIGPKISSANNPLRHRVVEGETVYSLAREYKVSVNSIATWNGLGPDLDIKTGREIIIPAATSTLLKEPNLKNNDLDKPKLEEVDKKQDQIGSSLTSGKKITLEEENKTTREKKSAIPKAKIISIKPFLSPVQGKIISKYSQDKGSQNNNGIDYQTLIGSEVQAVSNGTIVLISDIVGGNGKIVLIRHEGELITIYGRLTNVIVEKGQMVTQGQKIGEVIEDTETKRGIMHFEVRKGMKSIDPETMIR